MKKVKDLLDGEGYTVVNIDAVVIAQRPKLKDYIDKMIKNIAAALDTAAGNVNVKATTEEGLGFTGEGLGIAAFASCIIENKR